MCNDYAREIEAGRVIRLMKEMENIPPFGWEAGRIPNDAGPTPHVKITEKGLIARLKGDHLIGSMTTWAWKTPTGKPVFNFVSENRDFSKTERCLILATGFYEYTAPEKPKVKLKDQHLFTMRGEEWFWIAGIVKHNAFAMLTTEPGPDMEPYHDRQIVVLRPEQGMEWLRLSRPEAEILAVPPKKTLMHRQTRKNGVEIAETQHE
jgi:putative SOS response-associated peptidase YedK